MTTQQDTIFIQGLPDNIDERSLSTFFGQIGIIKVCQDHGCQPL